jgi:hypothetical protein
MFFSITLIIEDLLPGLKEGQQKMSNSDPYSAIFMFDDEVFLATFSQLLFTYSRPTDHIESLISGNIYA